MQAWLKRACQRAVEGAAQLSEADWAALREQIFPPGGPNEYLHLRVFMDTSDGLPLEEVQVTDVPDLLRRLLHRSEKPVLRVIVFCCICCQLSPSPSS